MSLAPGAKSTRAGRRTPTVDSANIAGYPDQAASYGSATSGWSATGPSASPVPPIGKQPPGLGERKFLREHRLTYHRPSLDSGETRRVCKLAGAEGYRHPMATEFDFYEDPALTNVQRRAQLPDAKRVRIDKAGKPDACFVEPVECQSCDDGYATRVEPCASLSYRGPLGGRQDRCQCCPDCRRVCYDQSMAMERDPTGRYATQLNGHTPEDP